MKNILLLMLILLLGYTSAQCRIKQKSNARYSGDTLYYTIEVQNASKDPIYIQTEYWDIVGYFPHGEYLNSTEDYYWMFYNAIELYDTIRANIPFFCGHTAPVIDSFPMFYKPKLFIRAFYSVGLQVIQPL